MTMRFQLSCYIFAQLTGQAFGQVVDCEKLVKSKVAIELIATEVSDLSDPPKISTKIYHVYREVDGTNRTYVKSDDGDTYNRLTLQHGNLLMLKVISADGTTKMRMEASYDPPLNEDLRAMKKVIAHTVIGAVTVNAVTSQERSEHTGRFLEVREKLLGPCHLTLNAYTTQSKTVTKAGAILRSSEASYSPELAMALDATTSITRPDGKTITTKLNFHHVRLDFKPFLVE